MIRDNILLVNNVGRVPAGCANRALIICARTKWTGGRLRVLSVNAVVIARVESGGGIHVRGTVTPLDVHWVYIPHHYKVGSAMPP